MEPLDPQGDASTGKPRTKRATPRAGRAADRPTRPRKDPSSGETEPLTAAAASPPAALAIAPGWYELEADQYHGDPCLTPSLSSHVAILAIQKSLLHAWRAHPKSSLFEEQIVSSTADKGSAAHTLLFGGKTIQLIDAEDFRSSAAREARDQARARNQIPILRHEAGALEAMIGPARERLMALHGGAFLCEQSAIWRRGKAGWRRARLDTLSPSGLLIVDYKTTEAAVDALSCERRIADQGLQIQAAAYVEAVETLHPKLQGRVRFIFQWQEQKPPFALSPPIEMSEAFMSLGREQWRIAGDLWDAALKHKAFPGFSSQPHLACPPPWELSRWAERVGADPGLKVLGARP